MRDFLEMNKKNLIYLGISALFLLALYLFFQYLFTFIAPFFFGWLLSLLFHPFVTFLHKKWKLPRSAGSLLAIFLFLGFIFSVVAGIAYRIIEEIKLFYNQLPYYITLFQQAIEHLNTQLDHFIHLLPDNLQLFFIGENNHFWELLQTMLTARTGGSSLNFMLAIPNLFMVCIVSLLASFFFTKDRNEINYFFTKHMPQHIKIWYQGIRQNMGEAVWGYIKTQMILMVVTFFVCFIGFFILHSPYSLLFSILISIIDALPFFGSGFFLWPMALVQLLTGNISLALGYMIIYLVATLLRQVLQPKVLGTQIGLPPLATLLSMYIGLKIMGVLGMIVGPILAVLLKAAFQIHIQTMDSKI